MKRFILLALLASLSACSTAYDFGANVKEGYQLGNDKIANIMVNPANSDMAKDQDFAIIKPILQKELRRAFANVGSGPTADLKVMVSGVSAEINGFTAAMVGDSYRINGTAEVWVNNRTNKIVDTRVTAGTGPYGAGLIGVINSATSTKEEELEYRNKVSTLFAEEVRGAIYPQYDN